MGEKKLENNILYLKINLKDINNIETSNVIKLNQKGNVCIAFLGNIYNDKLDRVSIDEIYDLYKKFGTNIKKYLDGIYTLLILDYTKWKMYIFQDDFGSNQNVYYYISNNVITISNQLKQIILDNKDNWNLDKKSVAQFLRKGYISNKDTFIEQIKKIPGGKYLKINFETKKIKLNRYIYKRQKDTKKITEELYDKTFKNVCLSSVHKDISITISSGYDTNYILYTLNKNTDKKINTFSIGGKIGRNEIPDAKNICDKYNNVSFHSKLVDGSSLKKYPEIVWILEGAIYESGIFLQYELAKLIKKYNCQNVILGECADQVLNYELYHPIFALYKKILYDLRKLPNKILNHINYKPYKDVYEMAAYKVIKKNGIIMNYFGITPEYPYLRQPFIDVAKGVAQKGDDKKKYHRKVIDNILPEDITKILRKIGGATELKTLFVNDIKLDNLKDIAKKSEFYQDKKFDDQFYEIDYFMKIIYIELFKKLFIQNSHKFKDNNFEDYDLTYFFPELKNKTKIEEGKIWKK